MRLHSLTILAIAAGVAVLCGTVPAAFHHWRIRSAVYSQRVAFATADAAEMARKYPLFMGQIVQDNAASVSEGVLPPVLQHVWNENTVVCLVRAVSNWIATNFLVRALSPKNVYDCAGLVALLLFVGVVVLVGGNVVSNVAIANTFRHNTKKQASRLRSPAAVVVDE